MVKSSVSSLRAGLTSGSCSGTGTGAGVNVDDGGVENLISWALVLAASMKFVLVSQEPSQVSLLVPVILTPRLINFFSCSTHLSMEQEK